MTKPLLAILLLLPLSVVAGELDGKAIICVNSDERYQTPFGIEFKNDVVLKWVIWAKGTVAKLQVLYPEDVAPKYWASATTVTWREGRYRLSRETLALEEFGYDAGVKLSRYDCDASSSMDALRESLEVARLELQREIDASIKDNKI